MKPSKLVQVLALGILSLAAASGSAFADIHCSPDIVVVNSHGATTSIKVKRLEYRIDGTTVFHTESVTNRVLTRNETTRYKSQRLGSASKGDRLDWRVVFAEDTGRGFGPDRTSNITDTSTSCENNVTYTATVQ